MWQRCVLGSCRRLVVPLRGIPTCGTLRAVKSVPSRGSVTCVHSHSSSRSRLSAAGRRQKRACHSTHSADAGSKAGPSDDAGELQNDGRTVKVLFGTDGVYTTAEPGENLWAVASKCGVTIPTLCNSGSCGTCEVLASIMMEVRKWDAEGIEGGTAIARTCIAAVPPGYARLQLDALDDAIWGNDGFDM